jgi:hypothetical protein
LSVPTVPEAVEPSPYLIFQLDPDWARYVLDFLGSKMLCFPASALRVAGERDVDHSFPLASAQDKTPEAEQVETAKTDLEIRTPRIKMQVHSLRRRPHIHRTYIQRIVLLIICLNLAWLLLPLLVDFAQDRYGGAFGFGEEGVLERFLGLVDALEGPGGRGGEVVFFEEAGVGFWGILVRGRRKVRNR